MGAESHRTDFVGKITEPEEEEPEDPYIKLCDLGGGLFLTVNYHSRLRYIDLSATGAVHIDYHGSVVAGTEAIDPHIIAKLGRQFRCSIRCNADTGRSCQSERAVVLPQYTNGNVLAKTLYAGSNFGTNNLQNELSYIQDYAQVSSTSASNSGHILAIGSGNTIGFEDNGNAFSINDRKIDSPKNLIQDKNTAETPLIDLDRVEREIVQIATRLNRFNAANLTYQSAAELRQNYSTLTLTTPSRCSPH